MSRYDPRSKWKRWTNEEIIRLQELKDQKLNLTEIAQHLDRSYGSIKSRNSYTESLNGKMEKKPPRIKTEPVKHYAKIMEITDRGIKMPCMRCGKTFLSWDRKKNRMCNNCRTSGVDTMFDYSVSGMKKTL